MDRSSFSVEGQYASSLRLRVLAVDANADAADSLAVLLRLWGYDVRVAYTGPDGLEEARTFQPDVVLSEIRLPGVDGYQLAERWRTELSGATLIAVTSLGQEADRIRSKVAGFARHLVKPADPEEIQELLAFAAYRKRAAAAFQAEAVPACS